MKWRLPSKRLIYLVIGLFPSPFTFLKFSPSCSEVFVPFFLSKLEKIPYSQAAYFLSSYYFLVLFVFFIIILLHTACELVRHQVFEMGFRLLWQGLISVFKCSHNMLATVPSSSSMTKSLSSTDRHLKTKPFACLTPSETGICFHHDRKLAQEVLSVTMQVACLSIEDSILLTWEPL